VKDPLEEVEIPLLRPKYWGAALLVTAIALVIMFPHGAAVVATVLALFLFIFLHELAHFWTAKRSDMKVTEFFVGFGPRLWSFRRGETEYGLKAIPLGGYCRIIGMTNLEEVPPEDEPRTYRQKKFLPKVIVAGAGSAMHFAIALVLTFILFAVGGDYPNRYPTNVPQSVAGPAAEAGIRAGDTIVAINGTRVADDWENAPDLIRPNIGEAVTFDIERDGEPMTITVEPATNLLVLGFAGRNVDGGVLVSNLDAVNSPLGKTIHDGDIVTAVNGQPVDVGGLADAVEANSDGQLELTIQDAQGETHTASVDIPDLGDEQVWGTREDRVYALAGIAPSVHVPNLTPWAAAAKTPGLVWEVGSTSVHALTDRFTPSGIREYIDTVSGKSDDDSARFVSPVGFAGLANDAVDAGWVNVMILLIGINVFVGIFNLVPLLPFDGGHIAIACYEKVMSMITRRRVQVDVAKLLPVTAVVVGVLAIIFFTSVFMDIARPMDSPF
jgi:membrane-associated protease RseP (regulator of RpoE activity)